MNRPTILLTLVLVYAAGFRILELNRSFAYDAEGSGCLNGVLARSYLRFGWHQSHGMPILSLDAAHATPIVFYPDHPPLVPLLIVPFYAGFGVGEWQTRLPIFLLTIATIALLYRMVGRTAANRVGLIAAAVFAATPMVLYFGGFADVVGMPLVFFLLLTVSQYSRFHDSPRLATLIPFVAAFVLAGVCDWPAYVIVPILTGHFLTTRSRKEWRWILAFVLAACALFVTLYVYITFATHSPWTWIVPLLSRRSAMLGGDQHSLSQWVRAAFSANRTYHSLPVLIVSVLWVAFSYRSRRSTAGATIALLLLAWAAAYAVIGSKALYDHEWAWIPFTPGLAVATALGIEWLLVAAGHLGLARLANWSVAALLALFATSTWYSTLSSLNPTERIGPFTSTEMGRAIQAAAPDRGDVALLVGGEEAEAQLWFYGDRALRTRIWSVQEFERRLHDDTVDLPYYFDEQPWQGRATGIVFPKATEHVYAELHVFLNQRYPLTKLPPGLAQKFDVFDLRRTTFDAELEGRIGSPSDFSVRTRR